MAKREAEVELGLIDVRAHDGGDLDELHVFILDQFEEIDERVLKSINDLLALHSRPATASFVSESDEDYHDNLADLTED